MKLKVMRLCPDAKLPIKATPGSICFDVFSTEEAMIVPKAKKILHTGIAFELQEGEGLDIRPRSGLASEGLIILNSPGTLDSDYRGELLISTYNLCGDIIYIKKGDRIAQIKPFWFPEDIEIEEIKELSETERGKGGFGSTGR